MKFRPRFSVRTLAIFVTLVCAYFGAWEATKKWGARVGPTTTYETDDYGNVHSFNDMIVATTSPMPFIVCRDERWIPPKGAMHLHSVPFRRYYLWFFGAEWRLPIKQRPIDDWRPEPTGLFVQETD